MKQRLLSLMAFAICSIMLTDAWGQPGSPVAAKVKAAKSQGADFQHVPLFRKLGDPDPAMKPVLNRGALLQLDKMALKTLKQQAPGSLRLQLPWTDGQVITVELVKNELFAPDFSVVTPGGTAPYQRGVYYQGIVEGSQRSVAAISIFDNEVMGVLDVEGIGNFVLGALDNDHNGRYAFFRSDDLKHDMKMDCQALDMPAQQKDELAPPEIAALDASKCVRIYFECEYDMYVGRGSTVQNTVDYMTGIYNVVKTLYDNEQVNTTISQIYVWTTPDSYPTTSTSDALNAFRNTRANNFNGDVAHLVSRGAPSGGGVAWVDVLCNKSYAFAYSYIYNSFSQFPTYSWTVEVITHEMGHNLGSRHTHNCSWDVDGNGTATEMIDGCGPAAGYTEGSCTAPPLPTGGGTIMSYCHLVSGVGINFNNGFGPLPGERIRSRVYNASCLTACSTCATTVSIAKTDVTTCYGGMGGSATATASGGIPPYTFSWSNGANTASITGLAAGTYTVTVRDQNGAGCATIASVTINQPAQIVLSATITNASIAGASDGAIDLTVTGGTAPYTYAWTPGGATTQDISALAAGTYTVTVTDTKGCTNTGSYTVSTACNSIVSTFPATESFELAEPWSLWKQSTADNFNWTRQSGATPTASTGPNAAADGTYYLYTEADAANNNARAILESICLDFRGKSAATVDFAYHMEGKQMGSLALDISTDNGASWANLWSRTGNQGTSWLNASVSIGTTYLGKIVRLRFVGTRGKGTTSDIGLDKVSVNATTAGCSSLTLSTAVQNASAADASDGRVDLTVSGGTPPFTFGWSNGANTEDISNLAPGTYTVTVTDANRCTGSATAIVSSACDTKISTFPAGESFETTTWPVWKQSATDNFDWTRLSGATPTASTGPDAAQDGNFYLYAEADGVNNNAKAILESHCIDLTGLSASSINFAYHMQGRQMGSLALEVSTDYGITWNTLWSRTGDQGGSWLNADVSLNSQLGKVIQLRFVATRGKGNTSDIAIDNININPASNTPSGLREAITASQKFDILQGELQWRSIYPNPAASQVFLDILSPATQYVTLQLTDAAGRNIAALGKASLVKGQNTVPLALPAGIRGMYFLTLQDGVKRITRKLQVLH